MAQKKELVQFTIQNNTDCDFNLPLLQRNVYSINATTKYSWNIQTIDLSCGSASIVVNGLTFPFTYTANSLSSFLSALNNLNFGFFCTETISSVNYLYTQDDVNVYGNINDCATGTTTSTTTSTTTVAPTTSTTTSTTTVAPTTSTTTTSTTAAPTTSTTTTTTTGAPFYNIDWYFSELADTAGQQIQLWYSENFGASWTLWFTSTLNINDYPSYYGVIGLAIASGNTVYLAATDISGNNIEYGVGNTSGDFTSKCGKSIPLIIPSVSATTSVYFNLNVSAGNFVLCSATTTSTTTTTTTVAPTTSTTTTTTTVAPTTSTTTTTTTEPPTTSTTTTTTTEPPTTSTTTTTTTVAPITLNSAYAANGANIRLEASSSSTLTETIEISITKTESHTYTSTNCGAGETIPNNLFPVQTAVISSGTTFGASVDITAIGTLQSTKIDSLTVIWSDTSSIFVSTNNTVVTSPVTGLNYLITNIGICTPL